ncbi:MAG: hypothetical protein NT075_12590 [Chloroflexi bacterium]|nr:hypothetical protein [Chloroflexota bacterium]
MTIQNSQDSQLIDEIEAELSQNGAPPTDDAAFEMLRMLLWDEYQGQIDQLQSDLNRLRTTFDVTDQEFKNDALLTQRISPIIAPAIMTSIHESRAMMIEALYPIVGQMVVRAVTESMRDLSRRIDHQMRSALSIGSFRTRFQARLRGVNGEALLLRQALPFHVEEVFLIHGASGLLLHHLSHDPEVHLDSDLISGMLTAIHDFAQNVLGHAAEDQLNQIQYGGKVILLEAAQQVYIAVVIEGVEPSGYRAQMREHVLEINLAYHNQLRDYDGDASQFLPLATQLALLMMAEDEKAKQKTIKRKKRLSATTNQATSLLPTPQRKSWSSTIIFIVGILVMLAFLGSLLLWQIRSAPTSIFSFSVRSII